jgi:hypothetical protein|tara:strand:+ start:231 stop:422 length:192 start_codon:yes stop_codon:yes gene_type:complete
MTKKTVQHEIKLEKSVKIILGALAIGVMAHAFTPDMGIKEALAEYYYGSADGAFHINLKCSGC